MKRPRTSAAGTSAARRRWARCERGTSAVEFAILSPVFCLVLVGAMDFGGALYTKFCLDGAVSAAADYAVNNANSVNSGSGSSLATNLASIAASGHASNWANATIVVNNGPSTTLASGVVTSGGTAGNADACYCPTSSGSVITWGSAMTCGASCPGTGVAGKFVSIVANRTYTPLFPAYHLLGNSSVFTARAVVQAQ